MLLSSTFQNNTHTIYTISKIQPEQTFLNLFGMGDDSSVTRSGAVKPIDGTDTCVILVASAQELPDVEALAEQSPGIPIVFYNLKLDILRGDLGAPPRPFPPHSCTVECRVLYCTYESNLILDLALRYLRYWKKCNNSIFCYSIAITHNLIG